MPPGADGPVSRFGTPMLTGRQFGSYEIGASIGAGGMGEVYRAHDTKLGRDVAIKILPTIYSTDPDRRARFEREARVLAALNHPHIGAIYGVEESDGIRALVLELVEGDTLAERIANGPLPIREVLGIVQQVAEALDAAHERGIVHRDLKPANIKITPDGIVKVLDFGLAKAAIGDGAGPDLTRSPTITRGGTRDGMLLGTAGYMSPEQVRGKLSDMRTDIWAFGCVLYEMLTGQVAFAGETLSDTIAAILGREPDWAVLPAATPPPIRRLLRRCLDKDVKRRLRDVADARADIDDVLSGVTPLSGPTPSIAAASTADLRMATVLVRRDPGRFVLATAVVLAAVAGVAFLLRPEAPETIRRNWIVPPEGYSFAPLMEGGAPALSPDGTKIAFVTEGPTGKSLWVQSLDAFDAKSLTGTERAAAPFWSPDGDELAFIADGSLKIVKPDGGTPRVLASGLRFGSQGALPGTWSSDGTVLFLGKSNSLWKVSSKGGEPEPATERNPAAMEQDHYGAFFLPDGRHFIALVRRGAELRLEVMLGELASNARKPLLIDVTYAQYAPGRNGRRSHLIFVRGGKLIARPFDDDKLELTGSERTLAENVAFTLGGGLADFSVSADGVLAYRHAAAGAQEEMAWYDRMGKRDGTLGDRRGHPRNIIRFSPSGTSVAFTRQGAKTQEVWVADVTSGHPERLTDNGRSPVWSPDGSEIAFLREDEKGKSDQPMYAIYRQKVDGSAPEVRVWSGPRIIVINDWSGDAQFLLLTVFATAKPGIALLLLPNPLSPAAPHAPVLFETQGQGHAQFFPPTGAPLGITIDGVSVLGMPKTKPARQVGSDNAILPRWSRNGRELFFHDGDYLQVAERVGSIADLKFGPPRPLFPLPFGFRIAAGQWVPGWDVTPDGQRFLVVNPPPDMPGPIAIVTNWDVD